MTNALTIFNQLRPHTIGYDNIFDHFNDMFESSGLQTNYPPYDIIKQDDAKYDIQVALAGYSKKDINIEYADNLLTIKSVKDSNSAKKDSESGVLHKGISKRFFSKTFNICNFFILENTFSITLKINYIIVLKRNCTCIIPYTIIS